MKKVKRVLIVILILLALVLAGLAGFIWYRDNHIFVEDAVYPIDSRSLDLREQDISFEHFDSVHSQLPDCEILWNVPFQGTKYSSDTQSIPVKALTQEDVALLKTYFPDLKKVDASGCDDYAMLEYLKEQLPETEVVYTVSLGGEAYDPDSTELTLENGDYTYDTLLENLKYIPAVTAVTLRMPELSQEQIGDLQTAYEQIAFTFTVEVLGQEYDVQTEKLDLSAMTPGDVAVIAQKLLLLPNLTEVELMTPEGTSQLSKADVKTLMEAAPNAFFNYSFEFYTYTLSTSDTEVIIKNKNIGDQGEADLRLTLDILPNCERFVMEYCQVSYDILSQIRDDYRDRTKIVWRVDFGKGSTLTDAQIIRALYGLTDANSKNLIYCEDVKYMDIGHNGDDGETYLHSCSYVAGMPKLEAIILSSAYISDLSPFANCKNLKFMEIAYCGMVTDLTPLAECKNLQMLNISFTGVTDLSPLDELPLTHLCAKNYKDKRVSEEEQNRFQELHPQCWAQYTGEQPYGPGWRYTEDGKDYLDYYKLLRAVFRYDLDPNIPNHVGWYLKDEETTYKE